jgi:hypothetical protein
VNMRDIVLWILINDLVEIPECISPVL